MNTREPRSNRPDPNFDPDSKVARPLSTRAVEFLADVYEFRNANDPTLRAMAGEALRFASEVQTNRNWTDKEKSRRPQPRWITILGKTGRGKTHLAKRFYKSWKESWQWREEARYKTGANIVDPGVWVYFPDQAARWRARDFDLDHQIERAAFLVLDEVILENESNGITTERLSRLLNKRLNRWTVITANLTLRQIADHDARIADRMHRDGNRVIRVEGKSYALQKTSS